MTNLTMMDSPIKKIERIADAYDIACRILNFLQENHGYLRDIRASRLSGYPEKADGKCVWLESHFLLSDIRGLTGRTNFERDDELLVSCLDTLVTSGEIKILEMRIREEDHAGDMFFKAVVGAGVLETFWPWNSPHLRQPIWFSSENAHNFSDPTITEVSKTFMEQRALRDKALSERFPCPVDLTLESKLHREKIMDDMRTKKALDTLASNAEKKK